MKKITVYIVLVLAAFGTISCNTDDVDNEQPVKLRYFSKIDYSKVYKGIKPIWADNFTVDTFYMQNSYDTIWKEKIMIPLLKKREL